MAKCSNCGKSKDILRTAVKNGKVLEDWCDQCLASYQGFADGARAFERKYQARHYAKDTLQTWEPEFIKAYGKDKAKEAGWSDEEIRRYS